MATGPVPCRILFLGEAPSTAEDKYGIPFYGKTGSELEKVYLPLALLHRDNVYIMNAAQCSTVDYENPTAEEAASCCNMFLGPTLMQVQPQIVVPMGAVACSVFSEITNLNLQHGIPLVLRYGSWSGVGFPMFHPSAAIHSPSYGIPLQSDFKRLGELIRELDQL